MDLKLEKLMSDGRLVHAAEGVIFPLIEEMITHRVAQAVGKLQGGETNFLGDISYIAALKEIESVLKSTQKKSTKHYEKTVGLETQEIVIPKNL